MPDILDRLAEGDMRQNEVSNKIVQEISNDHGLFETVFSGLFSDDPGLRMRCADAVEKVTRDYPELLQPHKAELLGALSKSEQQEVKWHVAQMFSRLDLNDMERKKAVTIAKRYYEDPKSKLVRVGGLQAIVELSRQDSSFKKTADEYLQKALEDSSHAMQARARHLLAGD